VASGKTHIVAQGEHLSAIARAYGFVSYKTIWNAPENAALKKTRKVPSVLLPGDELFIPERQTKEESASTDARHRFTSPRGDLKLRIVLMDLNKEVLAGHEGTLVVESETAEFTTGGDGKIERAIAKTAGVGKLFDRGKADAPIKVQREIPLKIGHLDPVDVLSGQIARLNNLGYDAGDPTLPLGAAPEDKTRQQQFQSAVEEFQCDFALKVDGICGKKTQDKLVDVHGC
jgi:hypothetical protein